MLTITVKTKFGKVEKVPLIKWKELLIYWPRIAKAFLEVLMEDKFNLYTSTIKRPNGFVADRSYWKRSMKNPEEFPLKEARRFISKLIEHKDFAESIRSFNARMKVDWLNEENIDILGGYVCSFYYTLKPVLKKCTIKRERTLKRTL